MSFNTGNNNDKGLGVLREAGEYIIRGNQGSFLRPIGDLKGTYAYLMREPQTGKQYYLVARGTQPYVKNFIKYVSTQKALILLAAEGNLPILLTYRKEGELVWTLFHGEEIRSAYLGGEKGYENKRLGSVMVNYEFDLGIKIPYPGNLLVTWEKLQNRFKEKPAVQTKLVTFNYPQHMITCPECGSQYSNLIPNGCPSCHS